LFALKETLFVLHSLSVSGNTRR